MTATIRLSELDAVNRMLQGIGKTPVNTLTNSGLGDVAKARLTLSQVSFEFQSAGHWWNTRRRTLTPRVDDDRIVLPNDMISVEPISPLQSFYVELDTADPTIRYLADGDTGSIVWDAPVELSAVMFVELVALPGHVSTLISADAALRFQNQQVGSPSLEAPLERAMARARQAYRKQELRQSKPNILTDGIRSGGPSFVVNRHRSQRYT